jgi:hypothetical protein
MYETNFDTEWDDLDKGSALERAFALGVARSLGEPNREEYERVRETASTTYERSLIELSYEEGRTKAAGRTDEERGAVWEALVVDPEGAASEGVAPRRGSSGPPSMMSRPEPTVIPDDGLDRISLPAFFRRR